MNKITLLYIDLFCGAGGASSGAVGQSIFYSVTRKGFEAITRRNGIRIRYEIEVNP